jgi:small-conductance mechanosensitive channel
MVMAAIAQAQTKAQESLESYDIGFGLIVTVLIIVVTAYVLAWVTDRLLKALADRLLADRFRLTLLIPILQVGIYAVGAYLIIRITVSPSPQQLVAFAGLFGAALGFGFKELVTDMLGGLSILFERPYRIGDKISIDDTYGEVVDIGLRSTQVVTLDDDLVTIPNHTFFRKSIVNANAGNAEMMVTMDFHVDANADPTTVTRIVKEAMATSQYVYVSDEHPLVARLDDNRYYYTITGKAYVNDLRNETAFRTDVSNRVLTAFHERGIEQPRPVVSE